MWHTRPELGELLTRLPDEWKDGWLTFESEGDKRRLAPVPPGWEEFSAARLELLRRMAEPTTTKLSTDAMLRREEKRPE